MEKASNIIRRRDGDDGTLPCRHLFGTKCSLWLPKAKLATLEHVCTAATDIRLQRSSDLFKPKSQSNGNEGSVTVYEVDDDWIDLL